MHTLPFSFVLFHRLSLPENTFSLYVLPFRLSNGITVNFVSEKELYECFTFRYNLLEIFSSYFINIRKNSGGLYIWQDHHLVPSSD